MVQSPIVLSLTWAEVEHFRGSSALQIFGKGGVCFFFFLKMVTCVWSSKKFRKASLLQGISLAARE